MPTKKVSETTKPDGSIIKTTETTKPDGSIVVLKETFDVNGRKKSEVETTKYPPKAQKATAMPTFGHSPPNKIATIPTVVGTTFDANEHKSEEDSNEEEVEINYKPPSKVFVPPVYEANNQNNRVEEQEQAPYMHNATYNNNFPHEQQPDYRPSAVAGLEIVTGNHTSVGQHNNEFEDNSPSKKGFCSRRRNKIISIVAVLAVIGAAAGVAAVFLTGKGQKGQSDTANDYSTSSTRQGAPESDSEPYLYTWPSEEGYVVAPSFAGTGSMYYRAFFIDDLTDCQKLCESQKATSGAFYPREDDMDGWEGNCFCDLATECLQPDTDPGGTIFSSVPQPDQCELSFCQYFPDGVGCEEGLGTFPYSWPSEEGFMIGLGYSAYSASSLELCAEQCAAKSSTSGFFLPRQQAGEIDICFCDSTSDCIEPNSVIQGGTVFSSVPMPDECSVSFCQKYPSDLLCEDAQEPNSSSPNTLPTRAPTPRPTPRPTPASTPSPTPRPTPASTPQPTPRPTPASTASTTSSTSSQLALYATQVFGARDGDCDVPSPSMRITCGAGGTPLLVSAGKSYQCTSATNEILCSYTSGSNTTVAYACGGTSAASLTTKVESMDFSSSCDGEGVAGYFIYLGQLCSSDSSAIWDTMQCNPEETLGQDDSGDNYCLTGGSCSGGFGAWGCSSMAMPSMSAAISESNIKSECLFGGDNDGSGSGQGIRRVLVSRAKMLYDVQEEGDQGGI